MRESVCGGATGARLLVEKCRRTRPRRAWLIVFPTSPSAFIPQLTEGPRGMSRRSSLLVLAAGVVAAALLYHDRWGGPIYLQDSFRDRAVGLTVDELRQLPGAGEPD